MSYRTSELKTEPRTSDEVQVLQFCTVNSVKVIVAARYELSVNERRLCVMVREGMLCSSEGGVCVCVCVCVCGVRK